MPVAYISAPSLNVRPLPYKYPRKIIFVKTKHSNVQY